MPILVPVLGHGWILDAVSASVPVLGRMYRVGCQLTSLPREQQAKPKPHCVPLACNLTSARLTLTSDFKQSADNLKSNTSFMDIASRYVRQTDQWDSP